jgi:hypothetical protein
VGFYLLNIGFALWIMEIYGQLNGTQEVVEKLAGKVGGFAIYLGIVLFAHLWLFFRGKRKASEARRHAIPCCTRQCLSAMKKHIVLAGGSGLIGQLLAPHFKAQGQPVVVLTRGKARNTNGIIYRTWDPSILSTCIANWKVPRP